MLEGLELLYVQRLSALVAIPAVAGVSVEHKGHSFNARMDKPALAGFLPTADENLVPKLVMLVVRVNGRHVAVLAPAVLEAGLGFVITLLEKISGRRVPQAMNPNPFRNPGST